MSAKITGSDLRVAIIEKAVAHTGPYDTSMLREVFDFCWEQLTWRATDSELTALIEELQAGLDQ